MNKKTTSKGFEIAKIRMRVLAYLINLLVFWLIGITLGHFFGELSADGSIHFKGLSAFVLFVCGFIIWPISEGLTGQSIGKWFLNLKVLKDDSESITLGHSFVRFFLGFLDYIFCIGIIIAYNDKLNKRLGDLVAKTVVVKCKKDE